MRAAYARDTGRAMSQRNVELVRSIYGLFGGRDFAEARDAADEVDTAFRVYLHPDFEIRIPERYPEGGEVFRGRDGVERWLAMIDDVWSEWRYQDHRYLDAGATVVAILRVVAKGSASGLQLDREVAHVWRISGNRVAGVTVYLDLDEALEAAGLRE
jgi:ketosteroid isomerase-like protein